MAKPRKGAGECSETDRIGSRLEDRVQVVLREVLARPLPGGLYVTATPVGNLADIGLRALAVLRGVEAIYCEDTRHTRHLLRHFGLSTALEPYHEHNAVRQRPRILARLQAGQAVALVSDAGTPLISDPGFKLVREVRAQGLPVTSIPGASAVMAGLTVAGLPTDHFYFEGFLPTKPAARRARLGVLKEIPATLVIFESGKRIEALLGDIAQAIPERDVAVARELTKLHETVLVDKAKILIAELENGGPHAVKGEFVVLIGPPGEAEDPGDDEIEAALRSALLETSLRDAASDVAEAFGVSRKRVYTIGLKLKRGEGNGEGT